MSGTRLAAVRTNIITSTAKIRAAIGALYIADKDAVAAQAISKRRRRKLRFVREAISEPIVAPACTAGASSPPDPPNPTENMPVTTGAKSQVRLRAPLLVDSAWSVAGIPPPGWSPPRIFLTNQAVRSNPMMGPSPMRDLKFENV